MPPNSSKPLTHEVVSFLAVRRAVQAIRYTARHQFLCLVQLSADDEGHVSRSLYAIADALAQLYPVPAPIAPRDLQALRIHQLSVPGALGTPCHPPCGCPTHTVLNRPAVPGATVLVAP